MSAQIISLIHIVSMLLFLFSGIYVLSLNPKSRMHQIFMTAIVSLAVWSFTLAAAIFAVDAQESWFWLKVSAIGWAVFFSHMLSFFVLITGRERWLRKKWINLLIYGPAVLTILLLIPSFLDTSVPASMIQMPFGWKRVSSYSFWDLYYQVFRTGYAVAMCVLVLRWKRDAEGKSISRYFHIVIGAAGLFMIGIGALDYMPSVPNLGPLPSLPIVIWLVFYLKKNQLIKKIRRERTAEPGRLLSDATKTLLIDALTLAHVLAAVLAFSVSYLVNNERSYTAASASGIMLLLGLLFHVVHRLQISSRLQNILHSATFAVSILFFMFYYAQESGSYAWIVPIVFIMIAVAMNQRMPLITASITTLLVLGAFAVLYTRQTVVITSADHIARIIVFVMFFAIGLYINRVFTNRLQEYEGQIATQKLHARISGDLVKASPGDIRSVLEDVLGSSAEHLNADTARLCFCTGKGQSEALFIWHRMKRVLTGFDSFPCLYPADSGHNPDRSRVWVIDVDQIASGDSLRNWMEQMNLYRIALVSLQSSKGTTGSLVFGRNQKAGEWSADNQLLMQMIGQQLMDAWTRTGAEQALTHLSLFDALTGLPNKEQFRARLRNSLELARERSRPVGVLYLDLDQFKSINDITGHETGDQILNQLGRQISDCLHSSDILSRYVGDEFLIAINSATNLESLYRMVDDVLLAIRKPIQIQGREHIITASLGLSTYPHDADNADELIKYADMAMYKSKEMGKNKCTFYSAQLMEEFMMKNDLISDLHGAVERKELTVYYQPKVNIITGKITGMEALVRWNHPQRGQISPGVFIPMAERIGVINQIDDWVCEEACRQNQAWQEMGLPPIKVSVNLSASQFYMQNITDKIRATLDRSQLNAAYLELEITESVAYYHANIISDLLHGVRTLGLSISLDDFGIEYSSLSRLQDLPIDRIKIDRQFVLGLERSAKGINIFKAIMSLGRSLGLEITVEGVETEKQLDIIRDLGCREVQGFYFYRPMPADKLEKLLVRQAEGIPSVHEQRALTLSARANTPSEHK